MRIARASESALRRELARAYRAILRDDESAQETHERRMTSIITKTYNAAFDTFGDRLWQSVQKAKQPTEQKRDVPLTPQYDMARKLWVATSAAFKVTEITGTTKDQAQAIIQKATEEAIADGLDESATAKLIRNRISNEGGDLSRLRSRIIARTESHAASTASTQMAARTSGLPMQREWIASGGERTRGAHAEANGQKVGMDEPFNVGGELLMVPGDTNGSASNVINCRCAVGYSLP